MAKILVVEDDPNLREAYIDILQIDGHSPDGVGSVTEAIETLTKLEPDVVFLDMQIIGGTAYPIISFIHHFPRLSHTKIVVVSGHTQMRAQAITSWGADSFLPKPFTVADIRSTLDSLNTVQQHSSVLKSLALA